jgi:uncharacterized damage-inducible protein DinB
VKATSSGISKYLGIISGTPEQIGLLVKGLEEDRLQYKTDARSWSVNDILAHLRSCADLWTHSIYAMLAEKEPSFSDVNERKWAKITRYAELPFYTSFQAFSLQRENLVRVLANLPFESWERSALISERRHTVFTQMRRMAKHETEHLDQIETLLRGTGK